jgi:pimeloyl-ACP methyl ester carboxylesterase
VHGFGASIYHWRHQIPNLSKDRPVYAIDLLGFGLSDKPLVEYSAELWRDQVGAFIEEVVKRPAVVAGNSLGGFTALYVASDFPALVAGCVLLNAAGSFSSDVPTTEADTLPGPVEKIQAWVSRAVIYGSFFLTKQPARIGQVLRQVYFVDPVNVDADLVESIRYPAETSPNCAEVFYRVIARTSSSMKGPRATIDALLPKLTSAGTPLWLVWGMSDPWIRPAVAERILQLKPDAVLVAINAGHCPHDERPLEVNAAFEDILRTCDGAEAGLVR